jgi:hypothetical protein
MRMRVIPGSVSLPDPDGLYRGEKRIPPAVTRDSAPPSRGLRTGAGATFVAARYGVRMASA